MVLKSIAKYVLFIFNLIFVIFGIAITAYGTSILVKLDEELSALPDVFNSSLSYLRYIPIVVIVLGCIMFLIAFSGCCGAICESKCLLITYACIMCVLAVAKICIVVTLFKNMNDYRELVEMSMDKTFTDSKDMFHRIEQSFKCCGKNGADSYGDGFLKTIPPTCCEAARKNCVLTICWCKKEYAYTHGCRTLIGDISVKYMIYAGYKCIIAIAVEVLATVTAVYLIKSIKQKYVLTYVRNVKYINE